MTVSSWTDDSRRICGPLLDRTDLRPHRPSAAHIEVPRIEHKELSNDRPEEPSAASRAKKLAGGWLGKPLPCLGYETGAIRARVDAARERQRQRFADTRLLSNADMGLPEVRDHCHGDGAGRGLLRAAVQQLHMSTRACDELF